MECNRNRIEDRHPVVIVQTQTPDIDATDSSSNLPSGRVTEIRRQWALHEDEALAYRLQTEEITQHYTGNRSRNAIVREDVPRAREEQKKEEQEALEIRFRQLSLLQQQAEEDSKYAKLIAAREERKLSTNRLQGQTEVNTHHEQDENWIGAAALDNSELDFDILDNEQNGITHASTSKSTNSSSSSGSCGIAVPSTSSACLRRSSGSSSSKLRNSDSSFELSEEELRHIQQQKDEALGRKLQEEIEQLDHDQKLAIEAQDRELAKVLYEKDKARLKRAKERAKLRKAAAAESGAGETSDSATHSEDNQNPRSSHDTRSISLNSPTSSSSHSRARASPSSSSRASQYSPSSSFQSDHPFPNSNTPPKIPEKTSKSNLARDDPIGFRANPKPLPPQPQPQVCSRFDIEEPIPPYMPMQGLNNSRISSKKK